MGTKISDRFSIDIMSSSPEVTGSCIYVTVNYPNAEKCHFLVDCGLFQEKEFSKLNDDFVFLPENVDFVLLTHNHIDHSARLPLLSKKGFNGKVYTHEDTCKLLPLALADTLHIIQSQSKRNSTHSLYNENDVDSILSKLVPCKYGETLKISNSIKVTFFKNGHLIGASSILVQIFCHSCKPINVFFTGDYHEKNIFFKVPNLPKWVLNLPITIISESTYGNMNSKEVIPCFKNNVCNFLNENQNGTIILPVFSLGRSQEILKVLKEMQNNEDISKIIPIYLDGKLTHRYTELFLSKALSSIDENRYEFFPENVTLVNKLSRSLVIGDSHKKIVVSSSGMGSYGPIQLYIRNYIKQPNALIHFTGYAAKGTTSRALYDAEENDIIEYSGTTSIKKAKVKFTSEFSAHAKNDELLRLLKKFNDINLILITHGEYDVKKIFAQNVLNEISAKDVGILSRDYFFRINASGLVKTISSHFI